MGTLSLDTRAQIRGVTRIKVGHRLIKVGHRLQTIPDPGQWCVLRRILTITDPVHRNSGQDCILEGSIHHICLWMVIHPSLLAIDHLLPLFPSLLVISTILQHSQLSYLDPIQAPPICSSVGGGFFVGFNGAIEL